MIESVPDPGEMERDDEAGIAAGWLADTLGTLEFDPETRAGLQRVAAILEKQSNWQAAYYAEHRNTLSVEADLAAAREALREAIDFAEEGWGYADDYFKAKWGYAETMAKLRALSASGAASQ